MRFSKFNNPAKKRKHRKAAKKYNVIVYNYKTHDFIERVSFKSYDAALDLCETYARGGDNPIRAYIE